MPDDPDPVDLGNLAGNRTLDIAAALHRQINNHRARTHARIHLARYQPRGGPAGNERRGDDDILPGDMVVNQRRLLGLIFLRHFLGIAAGGFRRLEFLVLDGEELGAERGDLFLDRRTHVGRRHHRTETPRRGNRLQPGDTDAHDEHFGRRHRARRRHHHRQGPVIFRCRIDHRLITGKIGLARQNVHDLRPCDARHEFHGEGRHPGIGQLLDRRIIAVRVEHGDDHRTLLVGFELGRPRPAHLQNHIGALDITGLADRSTRRLEVAIRNARCRAGTSLHDHDKPQPDKLLDRLRRTANPRLVAFDLFRYEQCLSQALTPKQVKHNKGSGPEGLWYSRSDGLQMALLCAPVLTYLKYAALRCSKTTIFVAS